MEGRRFTLKNRLDSLRYSLRGIWFVLQSQPNMWIIAAATVTSLFFCWYFHVPPADWCFVLIVIMLVWITEIWNTALEFFVDLVSPQYHPLAGKAKDAAAAASLVAVILALTVGLILFTPRFQQLFAEIYTRYAR